jgi:type I restriction enzyme M protein
MPDSTEQDFLNELDKKLWAAADRLRSNLDAAVYKHVVLGLIFLKYVSDAFELRQNELEAQFRDENHANFLDPKNFENEAELETNIHRELEERDYYAEENVFWVRGGARW